MEIFGKILSSTFSLFRMDLTILGFTFSFWEVFVFTVVVGVLAYIIGGFFSGG